MSEGRWRSDAQGRIYRDNDWRVTTSTIVQRLNESDALEARLQEAEAERDRLRAAQQAEQV